MSISVILLSSYRIWLKDSQNMRQVKNLKSGITGFIVSNQQKWE